MSLFDVSRLLRKASPAKPVSPAGALPDRISTLVQARAALDEDFFGGWDPGDIELFQRHARPSSPTKDKITDFLGIKTAERLVPWAGLLTNTVNAELPIPHDRVHAEAIEYFALLHSVECAPRDRFTIVELGASFGPWICTGAIVALRTGRTRIRLTAVEASRFLFELTASHLSDNEITTERADINLVHGAIATQPGTVYFPKVQTTGELGGQAINNLGEVDYLNRKIEHEQVRAYTLAEVLPEGVTDLLHVDIQGSEATVLPANIALLNERVRAVFVGIHGRKIEGELLELFHTNGWRLIRERPTRFAPFPERADIAGWTTRDGGQYWRNPRL
jgi:FkbM family methyltransferase